MTMEVSYLTTRGAAIAIATRGASPQAEPLRCQTVVATGSSAGSNCKPRVAPRVN